jgi:hypothetical protein
MYQMLSLIMNTPELAKQVVLRLAQPTTSIEEARRKLCLDFSAEPEKKKPRTGPATHGGGGDL